MLLGMDAQEVSKCLLSISPIYSTSVSAVCAIPFPGSGLILSLHYFCKISAGSDECEVVRAPKWLFQIPHVPKEHYQTQV
jgi:hypothetical protein